MKFVNNSTILGRKAGSKINHLIRVEMITFQRSEGKQRNQTKPSAGALNNGQENYSRTRSLTLHSTQHGVYLPFSLSLSISLCLSVSLVSVSLLSFLVIYLARKNNHQFDRVSATWLRGNPICAGI